jgi:hypothetical protein
LTRVSVVRDHFKVILAPHKTFNLSQTCFVYHIYILYKFFYRHEFIYTIWGHMVARLCETRETIRQGICCTSLDYMPLIATEPGCVCANFNIWTLSHIVKSKANTLTCHFQLNSFHKQRKHTIIVKVGLHSFNILYSYNGVYKNWVYKKILIYLFTKAK